MVPGGAHRRTAVRSHGPTRLPLPHHVLAQPLHSLGELFEAQVAALVTVHASEEGLHVGHAGTSRAGALARRRAASSCFTVTVSWASFRLPKGAIGPSGASLRFGLVSGSGLFAPFGKLLAHCFGGCLELLLGEFAVAVGIALGQHFLQAFGHPFRQFFQRDKSLFVGVEPFEHPHWVKSPTRWLGARLALFRGVSPSRRGGESDRENRRCHKKHPRHHKSP